MYFSYVDKRINMSICGEIAEMEKFSHIFPQYVNFAGHVGPRSIQIPFGDNISFAILK